MKVLITGGAGYLGSVLTHAMLVRGFEVAVLDNFRHGVASLNHLCSYPKLHIFRGDCRSFGKEISQFDVLVPLAALVGAPLCDDNPVDAWEINCRAVAELVLNAKPHQIIVYPNTNSGYGIGGQHLCTEGDVLKPLSTYGRSKVKAEAHVLAHPLGVAFRFATLFGASPRMRLDLMVNEFVYQAVRNKSIVLFEQDYRRNFLHVRDAAEAIIFAIKNIEMMKGQTFNAGNSEANTTKRGVCEEIKRCVPKEDFCIEEASFGTDPDKRDYIVSNEKLEALGWKPQYSLRDGIEELIRCYKQPFEQHRNA